MEQRWCCLEWLEIFFARPSQALKQMHALERSQTTNIITCRRCASTDRKVERGWDVFSLSDVKPEAASLPSGLITSCRCAAPRCASPGCP